MKILNRLGGYIRKDIAEKLSYLLEDEKLYEYQLEGNDKVMTITIGRIEVAKPKTIIDGQE